MANMLPDDDFRMSLSNNFSQVQLDAMIGGEDDPFQSVVYGLQWRPPEQHVLIVEDALEVCHVGLVAHTVEVNGQPVQVAGIGGVLTKREYRGRGLAVEALHAAESFATRELGVEFLFLFCRPGMRGWYETQNWNVVRDTVWVDQPDGTVPAPLLAMVKQLGVSGWPDGEVRLNSLPW